MPNEHKEIVTVSKTLELASQYRLEPEVVWSAVKIAKENPKRDFHQIFEDAKIEWDI
jgi:hypothetical protein